jgi:fatty acid desaturase
LGFIFAPYHISYHIEHHLYPYVPVFRLHQVHKYLEQNPIYKAKAHITRGYLQLFRELIRSSEQDHPTPLQSGASPSQSR